MDKNHNSIKELYSDKKYIEEAKHNNHELSNGLKFEDYLKFNQEELNLLRIGTEVMLLQEICAYTNIFDEYGSKVKTSLIKMIVERKEKFKSISSFSKYLGLSLPLTRKLINILEENNIIKVKLKDEKFPVRKEIILNGIPSNNIYPNIVKENGKWKIIK